MKIELKIETEKEKYIARGNTLKKAIANMDFNISIDDYADVSVSIEIEGKETSQRTWKYAHLKKALKESEDYLISSNASHY